MFLLFEVRAHLPEFYRVRYVRYCWSAYKLESRPSARTIDSEDTESHFYNKSLGWNNTGNRAPAMQLALL